MNDLNSQEALTAVESAYREIRNDICSGRLETGQRLTEQALAKRFGLSRTPVREAIGRLISEGFVERGEGYSTRVAQFAAEEFVEVMEMRARIEAYAAKQAALHAIAEEIDSLRKLADDMSERTPPRNQNDYETITQSNELFHKIIYAAARSPRLQVIMSTIVDVGMVALTYRKYSQRDLIRSAQQHHEIVDAIEARAPDWAESAMTAHILAALSSIRNTGGAAGGQPK